MIVVGWKAPILYSLLGGWKVLEPQAGKFQGRGAVLRSDLSHFLYPP